MSDQDSATAGLGGTIGARVARHVADAVANTRTRLGPYQASVAQKVLADFTNHVSDELRGVLAPLWTDLAKDPGTGPVVAELAGRLATQRGQAWAWVAGQATSQALGGGLLLALQNDLQPAVGRLIRLNPNIPLSPADAAAVVARHLNTYDWAAGDAGQQGINDERFRMLVGLNRPHPGVPDVLDLLNRGRIDQASAVAILQAQGYSDVDIGHLLSLRRKLTSVEIVAQMWNRGILGDDQAVSMGALDGATPEQVHQYLELGGEPPPLQELLLAWRRGIIDEGRLDRALKQSPIRFEYLDVVKSLQWLPLSPNEAADSVNQGHLDLAKARAAAAESGVRPEHFDLMIENAGLPPGVSFAHEAWNRGLIDEATFTTMFLESRLKNRYVDVYKAARWNPLPQETLMRIYRHGGYTTEQVLERLGWIGIAPDDRQALLAAENVGASASTVELTKSEILALFTDRAIDEATAREFLTELGLGDGEIGWLIVLAQIRQSKRYADAVVTRLRAGYVAHRLDQGEVSSIMDSLLIPPEQRDELISLWDLERLAVTKGLTTAQIQTAMRRGLIDPGGGRERLIQQGYSDADADVLVALTVPAAR
jgi:hypothetical protein